MYIQKYFKYKTKYLELKSKLDMNNKTTNNIDSYTNPNDKSIVITNDNIILQPVPSRSKRKIEFYFPEISIASVQYNEGPTGCTYIRFNVDKVNYYMDSRGGSVTTIGTDNSRYNNSIRGICFAGGSVIGLEAITGCTMEEMKKINYTNHSKCNIVGAMLRSANLDYNYIYPDKNLGRFAVNNLIPYPFNDKNNNNECISNIVYLGQVGVGCMAGDGFYGQGAYFKEYKGIKIFALAGVNALGAIYNDKGELLKNRWVESNEKSPYVSLDGNTTLTTIITDLSLDTAELKQLAVQCHTNMAVNIRPFHTIGDGDVLFSVTLNKINRKYIENFSILEFFDVCSKCTNSAVLNCFD
ncbi:endotype 6-aminohexanoat-oligomer hydrolase [Tupanvirus deep ocean]|uniref:Endotype 6-aminohexanoat-oligomer hydrolase n=2 Tax=Tupanvirus TaxID=2094720 RepID=A0AC62A9P1_9VIRU|nr:endotype 6-aminohexanoat-oligomer hydrolase [Tupanvirus deep ocean]QKU34343.1 endotype 6-aminohexanoat-oligomer hydrolase [Tupanvirus deep ocean]